MLKGNLGANISHKVLTIIREYMYADHCTYIQVRNIQLNPNIAELKIFCKV